MIRALRESDILGLNSLPPEDWKFDYEGFIKDFFIDEFFYAFVLIQDDKIVGTGNVFLKGRIGWLANIITCEKYRGKGLGSEMTKYLSSFLMSKGCETQLLIATELGEPVYSRLGFRKVADYQCFDSVKGWEYNISNSIRKLISSDLNDLYKLDLEANDEDRFHLLNKFYDSGLGYFNSEKELLGVYLPDFGRGLVLSKDKEAGRELLKLKHSKVGARTLVPTENQDAIDFLEMIGLKKGKRSSRMILGKENNWKPKYIYSYGSGYCG